MKKYIIILLVLLAPLMYAESVNSLINDFNQKNNYRRRYRAIYLLSKRKYIPILEKFTEIMTLSHHQMRESAGSLHRMRRMISYYLVFYTGVEYGKIKSYVSQFLVYLNTSYDLDTSSILIVSLSKIINKGGDLNHKVQIIKRIQSVVYKMRRLSSTNAYYRANKERIIRRILTALTIVKHKSALKVLRKMGEMNLREKHLQRIRKIIDTHYSS